MKNITPLHFLERARHHHNKMISLRRTIHQHPELAFEEFETAKLVAKTLKAHDVMVTTGVAKTGVIGLIKGSSKGRCVALRGDMDALPIEEQTGLPFASKKKGAMHACGHDSHTAMALGAAMILSDMRSAIPGSVKFLFQPSEERNPGGAKIMIEDGALANPKVDAIFGLHVISSQPAGRVGFCAGAMMAAADEIYITIKGVSGHGAKPHMAVDPIVVASQVVLALQTVISRRLDPFQEGVLTIGSFHGGSAPNIIPDEVKLVGTLRAMNERWRRQAHKMIRQSVEGIARAQGASAEMHFSFGYPPLINDEAVTKFARESARELLGKKNVFDVEPFMGAEDFAYYLQKVPGTFFRLGIRNEKKGITADIHNSRFTIDESAMINGSATLAYLAYKYLIA